MLRPAGWRIVAFTRLFRDGAPGAAAVLAPLLPERSVAASSDPLEAARDAASLEAAERAFAAEAQKIGLGPAFAKHGRPDAVNMGRGEQFIVGAARFLYNMLLKRGTEIYEYQATKLHSKLIVIDDVVHIGSANFDMRSLYLNLEMMLRIDDPPFAAMMRRFVEGEIANSKRILPEEHRKSMTLWNRIKWALGYFLVATADYNVARRLNFGKYRFRDS